MKNSDKLILTTFSVLGVIREEFVTKAKDRFGEDLFVENLESVALPVIEGQEQLSIVTRKSKRSKVQRYLVRLADRLIRAENEIIVRDKADLDGDFEEV